MPIQPPPTKFTYHYELHYSMKKTHPSPSNFEEFKRCVRESIQDLNLDERNRILTRNELRKVIRMVVTTEPALRKYEDYWPIRQYAKSYLKNLKRYKTKSRGRFEGKQPKTPRYDSSFQKRHGPNKSTSCTIIDLDVIELTSREGTPQPEPSTMATSDPARHPLSPMHQVFDLPSREASMMPEQLPLTPPVSVVASSLPPRSISSSGVTSAEITVTALCCMCPYTPLTEFTSFLNESLVRQFHPRVVLALLSFGIYFDHHLDFITGLDAAFRTELINRIPFENASAKRKFMEALRVPEPTKSAQTRLLFNDVDFEQQLQEAMHETDNKTFQDLMEIIRTESARLFDIDSPVVHQLRAAIRQIVKKKPAHFARYTNYWPIRLYFRRSALIGRVTPEYNERQEHEAFAGVFKDATQSLGNVNASCRAARVMVEQVPCKMHKPINLTGVSAKMRQHLSVLGVAELLPAFVQNGIQTYDDLKAYCSRRRETGTDLQGFVRLSSLQKFMLDLLCRLSPG